MEVGVDEGIGPESRCAASRPVPLPCSTPHPPDSGRLPQQVNTARAPAIHIWVTHPTLADPCADTHSVAQSPKSGEGLPMFAPWQARPDPARLAPFPFCSESFLLWRVP